MGTEPQALAEPSQFPQLSLNENSTAAGQEVLESAVTPATIWEGRQGRGWGEKGREGVYTMSENCHRW